MIKNLLYIFFILLLACNQKEEMPSAQQIVDLAIEKACADQCEKVELQFDFRGRSYHGLWDGGTFTLERITTDSLGVTKDVLDNEGFRRYRNDSLVQVKDSMAVKYANSVNSVHYFMRLPFGLNDPAVIKELIDTTSVKGEPYYRVKVTFKKEGGGSDYEDVFLYWFHRKNYTLDYLAYSYETDGGGLRFREAFHPRIINGFRFTDYRNYKPNSEQTVLTTLDSLFTAGELTFLSTIENTEIKVYPLED